MHTTREPKFAYLLVALICFLLIGPIATQLFGRADSLVLLVALNGTLLVGIFSLQESRTLFMTGIGLAALSVGITIYEGLVGQQAGLELMGLTTLLLFMLSSIYLAMRHLVAPGGISLNRLIGGACIYIMLGMVWAIFYVYVAFFQPNAFQGAISTADDSTVFWDLMYFGFVTMPALGYGDITPVTPVARVLAYLQAVVGQLYIAILIGSMVGAFISERAIDEKK